MNFKWSVFGDGIFVKKVLVHLVAIFISSGAFGQAFTTTWQTDNPGPSNDDQITIPTFSGETYNYDVDWGDGNSDTGVTGDITHTYAVPGTYVVSITGQFPRVYFDGGGFFSSNTDHDKILSVDQWGNNGWTSMASAFSGCVNLRINAFDAPDLSAVTDMSQLFFEAESLNDDISSWNVSTVTDMSNLFRDAESFNQPLDAWNVENVQDMEGMFRQAEAFNQPLNSWDVRNVLSMRDMFFIATNFDGDISNWQVENVEDMTAMFGSSAFNQDISGWVVDNVTSMSSMFNGAEQFNQDISSWNVGGVTNMSFMFSGASAFNADISGWNIGNVNNMGGLFRRANAFNADITGWDVSGVNDMASMFEDNTTFNQDISGWVVSSVGDMQDMFRGAIVFNQDISGWLVNNVGDMSGMFEGAVAFNQDISGWNVSNVDDMRFMFSDASAFDQNLGGWDVTSVRFMLGMFDNSGLSIENYDNALIGWNSQSVRNNVSLSASGIFYCAAELARAELITNNGWFISDGGRACISVFDGGDPTALQIQNGQSAPIDFGSINLLPSTKTRNITILNQIATPVTGLDVSITGTAFSIVPTAPTTIAPGTFETLNVVLSGNVPGSFTETLTITSASFSTPFVFTLTGEITVNPEPEIAVFEGSTIVGTEIVDDQVFPYDFGSELRGTPLTREIAITNKGSTALDITGMSISGTAFSFAAATPATIAVDAVEVVQIVLEGTTPGFFQETLTIINNDVDESTFNFNIEGEIIGPDIVVWEAPSIFAGPQIFDGQTASLDFGSGAQGIDITRQITIGNFNPVDLAISNISISGTAFSTTAVTPFVVAAEIDGIISGVTIDIILSGTNPGSFDETIVITSDDQDEPAFTFPLSGQIGSGFPEIAVFDGGGAAVFDGQAAAVDFGSQVQGSGINQTFSINNQGTMDLTVTNITVTGTDFVLNSAISFPLVIGGGGNELLDLFLNGTNVGVFTATVAIESDDADEGTFNFEITGEITSPPAPEIAVFVGSDVSGPQILDGQASPIDFGTTPQGANLTFQITIQNQGTADLDLNTYSFSPSGDFFISATPPSNINPGAFETIDVEFDASNIGVSTATFEIENNDADETVFDFQVTAEVTPPPAPEIAVFLGPDNTGTEILNGQSALVSIGSSDVGTDITQTFTIENSGSAVLTINDITFSDLTFSTAIGLPFTVAGGSSESFDVILDGTIAGEFGADVTIDNDDSDEAPFTFPIQGSIVVPNSIPTISPIADVTIDEDGTTGDIPFIINDAETNLDDLIVTAFSSNPGVVTAGGIVLGGSGGSRTIEVTPEPDANGTVLVTVEVDDTQDIAVETFSITVNAVNDAPVITGQQTITTPQNTAVIIELDNLLVSDVDNTFPTGFSLSVSTGQNYTVNGSSVLPNLDFVGDLLVPIVVNDGSDDSAPFNATVTVIEGELTVSNGATGDPLANGGTISFDDIPVGAEDRRELEISNSGTVPLVISEILIDGDDFSLLSDIPDPIQPGGSFSVSLSFQPSSPGPKSALLTIRSSSAADFTTTLTASGLSEIPPIEVFNVVTTQRNDKHDFLEIRNIEFYDSNRVFIYSRWGNEVYNTTAYNNTDNRFVGNSDDGDELPDGTYYYVIELNGGEIVENGFFLLRR